MNLIIKEAKLMKKLFTLFMALTTIAIACPPKSLKGEPDQTIQKEGWVLKVWVTAKGTRSEGHVSHLYHDGKEVCPINGTNDIVTPLGKLHYFKNRMPWGWHGWKLVSKPLLIAP